MKPFICVILTVAGEAILTEHASEAGALAHANGVMERAKQYGFRSATVARSIIQVAPNQREFVIP